MGFYVLGALGPFSGIDEAFREQYADLKLLEDVMVALGEIDKSKPRGSDGVRKRHNSERQSRGL